MRNLKQAASNLISHEYSTGRCWSRCEQCFVNWGQQGFTTAPLFLSSSAWYRKALLEGARAAHECAIPYKPPPELDPAGPPPEGHEWLIAALTRTGKGLWNIPKVTAWAIPRRARVKVGGYVFEPFLRVSSMSDSSYAPRSWVRAVRERWGDRCFFNTSIRSAARSSVSGVLGEFHSVVITANPGHQRLPGFRPSHSRPVDGTPWTREAAPMVGVPGSMGPIGDQPGDFLHPLTAGDEGLAFLGPRVRWYRLRALPTIAGRLMTDSPVVVTQLRFSGIVHVAEFCRRYRLGFEVRPRKALSRAVREGIRACGFDPASVVKRPSGKQTEVLVWSDRDDVRNALVGYRGQASTFVYRAAFLRPVDPFDWAPYVCDRLGGSCKSCGLCASLDGAQPGWANRLNVMPRTLGLGKFFAPRPFEGGYIHEAIMRKKGRKNPGPGRPDEDFFEGVLLDMVRVSTAPNPGGSGWAPTTPAAASAGLSEVGRYLRKGQEDAAEDWNTHEQAEEVLAYAIWSLVRHALAEGYGADFVLAVVADATEGLDIWDDALRELLVLRGVWAEQFE